ncbi:hypothetical protein BJV82DRAFT_234912 [Fennellomyces sp. T-0311]|nr:hypothetical protein BJV82DRAFT_234912 [Fennellomyces sp. T-0311]
MLLNSSCRASQLPPYRKLRQFHNGFFLSNLRNVAYAELKDHMAILLVVIHDLVDPQFIISMRYFIDFYFSATSKEHTDASLQIVQDSLEDFQKYSAIFAKYSKCGLAFPKKHMLSKYVGDIRNMGCIDGYSTQQSEHQHKKDAKSPAKRTNERYSSVKQMAEFVHRRDLLFDMQAQNSQPRIEKPNLGVQPTTHKLISKLNPSSINELFASHVNVGQFERLLRSFLDTRMEGRNSTRNLSNMPKLDTEIVTRYQTLIIDDYDVDGICVREKVHARENYHGRDRYDYAIFRDGESGHIYGHVIMFFKAVYKGAAISLCLARRYFHTNDGPHITGLTTVEPGLNRSYRGLFISLVHDLIQPIYIVPDFSSGKFDGNDALYRRYLVNTDTDHLSRSVAQPSTVPLLPSFITWEHVSDEHSEAETDTTIDGVNNTSTSDISEDDPMVE